MTQLSIQGERTQRAKARRASPAYVSNYAATCSPGVFTCRWRGRHDYPIPDELDFHGTYGDGLLYREDPCKDCGCAHQVQLWEPYERRIGKVMVPDVRFVAAFIDYRKNHLGETYVSTDGLMTTKAFRAAAASNRLTASSQKMVRDMIRQQKRGKKG